jgi:hypothetical protein
MNEELYSLHRLEISLLSSMFNRFADSPPNPYDAQQTTY